MPSQNKLSMPPLPPVENLAAREALERLALASQTGNVIAAHRAQRFNAAIIALLALYSDLTYDPGIVPDSSSWLYLQEQTLKLATLVRDLGPKETDTNA